MIQDWMLERYRLNELAAGERTEVERALAADAALRARLEAIDADSKATLERFTPRAVAVEVQRRSSVEAAPRRSLVPALAVSFGLVIAAAVALQLRGPRGDDIIIKGTGPSLLIFRQTDSKPERLSDGAKVHPHDRVQVEVNLAGQSALVVVSIDGGGKVTQHYAGVDPSLKELPQSFELDEAPGFERFFLVTSEKSLDIEAVMHAAEALASRPDARTASLALPSNTLQRSLLLEKAQ